MLWLKEHPEKAVTSNPVHKKDKHITDEEFNSIEDELDLMHNVRLSDNARWLPRAQDEPIVRAFLEGLGPEKVKAFSKERKKRGYVPFVRHEPPLTDEKKRENTP